MRKRKANARAKKTMNSAPANDVDAYIKAAPPEARPMLERLRRTIKAAAPQASEVISYGMPSYKVNGTAVAGFAAAKAHCGFYPMSGSYVAEHQDELKGYATSKGAIRLPLDKPLPVALVKKIVKARMKENEARSKASKK